ncbi:hypothetical protein GCM10012275_13860 [Longimycelium tulufanense]|uniref:Uncharacterized protein n=1 Tax=Longimycelium tulufanense TaxID=907463 RepID=A0A8J3CBQ2_9PSEU|nr:lanthionine synthetase LanC family protein [Longimycelium tulufanense]GGM44062.1 hypothetical protein GCM10012275_13860 [Longimycelium tulufanense]
MDHDDSRTRARALEVVAAVAERLSDPRHVAAHATPTAEYAGSLLANGHAGVALLFIELGRWEPRWNVPGTAHLLASVAGLKGAASRVGLFGGLAGLGFACRLVASEQEGYLSVRQHVRSPVNATAVRLAAALHERFSHGEPNLGVNDYDLFYGLTGLGTYLLAEDKADDGGLVGVIDALSLLAGTREIAGHRVPSAWVERTPLIGYPQGYLNLGLAHGLAGVLAFLASALLVGVEFPRQRETVEHLATWLLAQRRPDRRGRLCWPRILSFGEVTGVANTTPLTQLGWCYGSVGVANALRLAARALHRPEWMRDAITTMRDGFDVAGDLDHVRDAGICHGWAGLLCLVLRALDDVTEPQARDALQELSTTLAERVLGQFEPDSRFGFRAVHGNEMYDDPGFALGAAGTALALHAYATGQPPRSGWDSALLLVPPPVDGSAE